MRLPRTLSAYALGEVLLYAALGLAALATLLVGRNLLRHLDELLRAGSSASEIGTVVACLAVTLATYALPVAFLFGVLLAIGRLAGDSEVLAMQSCGVGLRSIVFPVALLGLGFTVTTAYLTTEVEHRAQRLLRLTLQKLAAEGRLIEAGEFRRVGERILFVKERDADAGLHGVLIADHSNPGRPLLIFAERGALHWEAERGLLHLRLANGTIHLGPEPADLAGAGASADALAAVSAAAPTGAVAEVALTGAFPATDAVAGADPLSVGPVGSAAGEGPDRRYRRILFQGFDYAFGADELLGVSLTAHRPREMSNAQLRDVIARARRGEALTDLRRKDPLDYELQLHRRLALPAAPLLFAIVGVPLALGPARRGRSRGLLLCALAAFGYYALLTFAQTLARDGTLPPVAAAWLPNLAFAAIACVLLRRATRVGGIR